MVDFLNIDARKLPPLFPAEGVPVGEDAEAAAGVAAGVVAGASTSFREGSMAQLNSLKGARPRLEHIGRSDFKDLEDLEDGSEASAAPTLFGVAAPDEGPWSDGCESGNG